MAAATTNGHTNGNVPSDQVVPLYPRFSGVPSALDIPVSGGEGDEAVNLDLTELADDTEELCDLLENENAAKTYWITIALAYAQQNKINIAVEVLEKASRAYSRGRNEDRLSILACLCWLHLWRCRHAPRVKPAQSRARDVGGEDEDVRTKDECLHAATSVLNEATKMSPSHPPLFMARGTLYLLRASLQPSKHTPGAIDHSDRAETLRQASKCFEDALRVSNGRNILALLGKAKVAYSLSQIPTALQLYQQALERAPDMLDPDPRIGIGVCLWALGHKEPALTAWQRSAELNPNSVIAQALLGVYWIDQVNQHSPSDPEFQDLTKKAFTLHTQSAFKLDSMHALTCAQFGSYFLRRRAWQNVERLARRAIELTDVNAIASDGWYLLALQSHYEGDIEKAEGHYTKADQARGGDDRGYLPAKFGAAQLMTLREDTNGAKFKLEKMVERTKNAEAMTLLGVLFADEVFANQAAGGKEDKSMEAKRAISWLESVRVSWRDPKRKTKREVSVLLNLARLYEADEPGKALACLNEAEEMLIADISEEDLPEEVVDEDEERRAKRELLPPQLLNNVGCFHFAAEKYAEAREDFQTALNACVKLRDKREQQEQEQTNGIAEESAAAAAEAEAMITTISYNLARTYEAEGLPYEAQKIYHGTLDRHPDYIDARMRLAYLSFQGPTEAEAGGEAIQSLLTSDPANLDVRALYGWYTHQTKKRTLALNEDTEQRHYKHTLQNHDKHDVYSLVGMGNLHLAVAREMPRDTDAHREKRSRMYGRAAEFFDKVLSLDPRNAFAAQGLAIAVVEEKKDTALGVQTFTRVRESLKGEASVYINLGHVFAEVKQFSRAVENYEIALAKSPKREPQILACLGRVWLVRGRAERRLDAYKFSLDFAREALEAAPGDLRFKFNVAFVQMQLVQMVVSLPESKRTLEDVEMAGAGLEEAIEAFGQIAKEPTPPFPRGDIEQRANMGRNTMRRQVAAAIERQAEWEGANRERLEEAKRRREEEAQRKIEQDRAEREKREEMERRVREERERIAQEDRELIARRVEEEKAKKEAEEALWTTDEETGEKKKKERKRKGGKRKKKDEGSDEDLDGTDVEGGRRSGAATGPDGTPMTGSDAEGRKRKTKKRKLESRKSRASAASSKYKSADMVIDSSDDDDDGGAAAASADRDDDGDSAMAGTPGDLGADTRGAAGLEEEAEDEEAARRLAEKREKRRKVIDDDDEDEDEAVPAAGSSDHGGDGIGD